MLGLHHKEPLQQVLQVPAAASRARIRSTTRGCSLMIHSSESGTWRRIYSQPANSAGLIFSGRLKHVHTTESAGSGNGAELTKPQGSL